MTLTYAGAGPERVEAGVGDGLVGGARQIVGEPG